VYFIIGFVRAAPLLLLLVALAACGAPAREYEYEEEMYLSLDGSATIYVNSSVAALNALRGTSFDARAGARVDRARVRQFFTTPVTRVGFVRDSRRHNRRYVHVRLDVDDVRQLEAAAPFAWSTYRFEPREHAVRFEQRVGAPAARPADAGLWSGAEVVAFRLHVPSEILSHNAALGVGRGNILAWEQTIAERLRGDPVELDVRMGTQSILALTLGLLAGAVMLVAAGFAAVVWRLKRRGATRAAARGTHAA
jgi:hypothetical protein